MSRCHGERNSRCSVGGVWLETRSAEENHEPWIRWGVSYDGKRKGFVFKYFCFIGTWIPVSSVMLK